MNNVLSNNVLARFCGFGCAAIGILLVAAAPSYAAALPSPAPVIGITGPFGIAAAAIGYGGYQVYKRLKSRG